MALPELPEYITGNFVTTYIAACSEEVQQRYEDALARSRITISETDDVLRTEQVELFMSVI